MAVFEGSTDAPNLAEPAVYSCLRLEYQWVLRRGEGLVPVVDDGVGG